MRVINEMQIKQLKARREIKIGRVLQCTERGTLIFNKKHKIIIIERDMK